ncbi:unnamed protein product [Rotaria socialis]|uniref:Uncharacterized protein n=1 Tax=Rotaria socialis TaxID=392032 RepID=A0A821S0M3_9BILA|nr:unnamed protein product [Rotaria socialis]
MEVDNHIYDLQTLETNKLIKSRLRDYYCIQGAIKVFVYFWERPITLNLTSKKEILQYSSIPDICVLIDIGLSTNKPSAKSMAFFFLFGRGRNNHVHPVNSTPLNTNTKMSMEDENTESTPTTNLDNANKSTEQNNRIPSITGVGGDSIEYDYSIKAPPNMPNFKTKVGAVEAQLPEILKGQSYKHPQLTQLAHTETKISTSCEEIPAIKMIRTKHIFHSIPLYIEDGVKLTDRMLDHAKQLSHLLRCLATHVFKADVKNLHIFRDIKTDRIAFNFGGAIFFNLRYFEQVYADELEPLLQQLSSSKPMIHTIVNFYFMVYCHELSHNIAKGHDEAFVQCIERVAVRFMTDKDMLLEHFSFKDSMKNLN